ncbi:hypothetical protein GWK47_042998 [Chionoecetes opilio]|uniref:Uncharacterized protein n=1 Tax=Chionoecetes opilio TaxID=41210 RepID=A0A8J5CW40_CHIOP|nr:hypothetical protein GWK47_042998 [Chionoecetes opilio]
MLREVCRDVSTEPTLLPLDGEHMRYRTANTANEARVGVSARGFWTKGRRAFMDIRIFDPMAACHRELSLEAAHQRNEQEKIRAYGERIQHVDQGSFTPPGLHYVRRDGPQDQVLLFKTSRCNGRKEAPAKEPRCRLDEVPSLLLPAQVCPPMSQGY